MMTLLTRLNIQVPLNMPPLPPPLDAASPRQRLLALKNAGKLRLDGEEIDALAHALSEAPPGRISLFGSRVDPERRGGDIDLLILTDAPAFETSRRIATRFFSRCEEKLDVVVMNPDSLSPEQADFLSRIHRVEILP